MKPVRPVGIPTLLLLAFLTLSAPAQGQDSCPSASGPGAEAGWAAYADNDIAEARRRFEAAVALCHNDQYARTGLGYVNLRDGNVQEAERLWTVVGTAEPNNVDALVGWAWRGGVRGTSTPSATTSARSSNSNRGTRRPSSIWSESPELTQPWRLPTTVPTRPGAAGTSRSRCGCTATASWPIQRTGQRCYGWRSCGRGRGSTMRR